MEKLARNGDAVHSWIEVIRKSGARGHRCRGRACCGSENQDAEARPLGTEGEAIGRERPRSCADRGQTAATYRLRNGSPSLLERKRAPHVTTSQITFGFSSMLSRERLPSLGSVGELMALAGLRWPSDGPGYDRSPNCNGGDCKNHRDESPRPPIVVGGLCHRCDLGLLSWVNLSDVCHSDPPRDDMREEVGLSPIGVHPQNGGLQRAKLAMTWRRCKSAS